MIFLQAEPGVNLPIWVILVAIAIPAAMVGLQQLFSNNKKFIRGQLEARLNEMIIGEQLPSAASQKEIKESLDDIDDTLTNGLIADVAGLKEWREKTDKHLDLQDNKLNALLDHFGLEI